jgi:hypothetical protein
MSVKLVIFLLLALISFVMSQYKKSQEEAKRRAEEADRLPRRPPTRKPVPVPLEEEAFDEDDEQEEPAPVFVAPPPVTRTAVRPQSIVPTATPLALPPGRRPALRLTRARARAAIVLMEVIGPPVALR